MDVPVMKNLEIKAFEKVVKGNPIYDKDLRIAPWKIDVNDFARIDNSELVEKTLNVIKNDHLMLVLTSEDGVRYGNTILIKFDEESLSIDKPIDFDENTISRFRIYYQDILDVWNFFEVDVISDCMYSLCATYPEAIYRLQRRRHHRINLPEGTRTVFWQDEKIHNGGIVRDISVAGMLICTCETEEKFSEKVEINDIAIALPLHPSANGNDGEDREILPVIKKGRIVRSFRESGTDWVCHGVSFDDELDVEEEIGRFVETRSGKDNLDD